jgi:uncharacterized membrane protein (DUF485 family)
MVGYVRMRGLRMRGLRTRGRRSFTCGRRWRMLHEPAAKTGKDPAFAYKRRLGVIMFAVYGAIYAGFVIVNLVSPQLAGTTLFGGQNLDVVYGIGLIVLALALALVYNSACTRQEKAMAAKPSAAKAPTAAKAAAKPAAKPAARTSAGGAGSRPAAKGRGRK